MSVTKCIRNKNGKKITFYRAQVYVSGIRVADHVFDTQAAAYTWHDDEKSKAELGISENPHGDMLFNDCVTKFIEERLSKFERYSYEVRMALIVYLRECPLSNLKMANLRAGAVDAWINWLLKHKSAKRIHRKSFANELKLLSTMLNWYRNYIDADFVVPITKRHREMIRYKRVKPRRPDYYAKPEEVRNWIQWLRSHRNPVYYRLATFMMLTGARVGEAAGLCWEEVDLTNRVARVVRIVSWGHTTKQPFLEERTKTDGSVRLLMLPEVLVNLLQEMRSECDGTGIIFRNREGEMLKYNAIQSAFNAGFVKLNLPWRSTHICRHTYATLALIATRDLSGVQASLGHSKQSQTEKYAKNIALLESSTAEKTAALIRLSVN